MRRETKDFHRRVVALDVLRRQWLERRRVAKSLVRRLGDEERLLDDLGQGLHTRATFTVSPMAVYSIRRGDPILPTTARPVWIPMPIARGAAPWA